MKRIGIWRATSSYEETFTYCDEEMAEAEWNALLSHWRKYLSHDDPSELHELSVDDGSKIIIRLNCVQMLGWNTTDELAEQKQIQREVGQSKIKQRVERAVKEATGSNVGFKG
jgi:hypothetical protein